MTDTVQRPAREEQALREIGRTEVAPRLARAWVAFFLLTVAAVPALQLFVGPGEADPFAELAASLPAVLTRAEGPVAANRALLARIDVFEDALERASWLQRAALPPAQRVLVAWGGVGNEQVYVGRGGWLYLRPGVDLVTGKPLLAPEVLERRRLAAESWRRPPAADPVPALLDLAGQLRRRGIELLVMPVPTKAAVVPEGLARDAEPLEPGARPLQNPSFGALRDRLEAAGVRFFDPTATLLRARRECGCNVYLRTDSHWSPEGVRAVAAELAVRLRLLGLATGGEEVAWRRRSERVRGHGDLVRMLELPEGQRLFPPEEVTLERVEGPGGEPWRAQEEAAVLLLGDSFANVFSQPGLGWGEGAGLAEQLAFELRRPVDRLAVNDGGDLETRQRLASELASGSDRLAGKRSVVYAFAARELAIGDWRPVELPEVPGDSQPVELPDVPGDLPGGASRVRATLEAAARTPDPASTPYRDVLVALHLVAVEALEGEVAPEELLVYTWGLRDGRPTPAARYRPGQRIELRLVPWGEAAAEVETYQRIELDDDDLLFLDAYWAPEPPPAP